MIASANTDADVAMEETLTQAGITVAYFDVANFDDYLNNTFHLYTDHRQR